MARADGQKATFRGQYAACPEHEDVDMSGLGRDILEMFVLIAARRADVVAILGGPHYDTIAFQSTES